MKYLVTLVKIVEFRANVEAEADSREAAMTRAEDTDAKLEWTSVHESIQAIAAIAERVP